MTDDEQTYIEANCFFEDNLEVIEAAESFDSIDAYTGPRERERCGDQRPAGG